MPILLLLLRYSNVNISATSGDCVHTQTERPTWMVVFPPSSKAMARRMLSWKTRSLVVFMMRSMTRSDAPSLSRWHCTSARLICPRLRPPTPPRAAGDKGQYYCNTGIQTLALTTISHHWSPISPPSGESTVALKPIQVKIKPKKKKSFQKPLFTLLNLDYSH